MEVKGVGKIVEKLGGSYGRLRLYFFGAVCVFIAALSFQILCDILTKSYVFGRGSYYPILPLPFFPVLLPFIGNASVILIGGSVIIFIFINKNKLIEKYGDGVYRYVFPRFIIGLAFLFSAVAHVFVILPIFGFAASDSDVYNLLYLPLYVSLGGDIRLAPIAFILGILILTVGAALGRTAVSEFGMDYMTLVYMFYPDEAEIRDLDIYSVLRHPTYAGLLTVLGAGAVIGFSPYSFFNFIFFLCYLLFHIYRIEEKELVERFGEGYLEYRKKVPALIVRPSKLSKFFGIIFRRKKER